MGAERMKTPLKFALGLVLAAAFSIYALFSIAANNMTNGNGMKISDTEKLGITRRLVLEGKALLRQGRYSEAEQKFITADDPKYWLYEGRPSGTARAWLRAALVAQGKYEEALESVRDNLSIIPDHAPSLDEQLVYQAMIKSRDSNDMKPIYGAVNALREKYADILPPQKYIGIGTLSTIATILRLYDTIADYDAGIAYIDEILGFLKERRKAKGDSTYVLYDLESAQAATECMNRPKPNPNYLGCKFVREYLLIREAFEQDKAEGRGSCLGKPECVGRATQALIKSDYFPW